MNQILSNIKKIVDDSVRLFTQEISEKYNIDQNDLYDLWKQTRGNDDIGDENEIEQKPRKITKKKIPKSNKEKAVKSPLEKKSIPALKKMCKELGLKKFSSLKKNQLIEMLQQNDKKDYEQSLEDVLDEVQENMEKLDIQEPVLEKKEQDFDEEDIVEEY